MVYLLHFDRPFHHIRHFLTVAPKEALSVGGGVSAAVVARSPLLDAALGAGVSITVTRTWNGDAVRAQQLQAHANSRRYCPVCTLKPNAEAR